MYLYKHGYPPCAIHGTTTPHSWYPNPLSWYSNSLLVLQPPIPGTPTYAQGSVGARAGARDAWKILQALSEVEVKPMPYLLSGLPEFPIKIDFRVASFNN